MNSKFINNNVALIKPAEHYVIDMQDNKAKFRIEPLQKGFGTTLGNALRRVMLSSIAGTAVIGVKIEGVEHEYSVISGVKEDVIDIILNLKSLVVTSDGDTRKTLHLKVTGQTVVTADMIMTAPGVEILNKDLVICTLVDSNSAIDMEIYVGNGNGYTTSEQNKKLLPNLGHYHNIIGIDAIFSPIKRVSFSVETYYSSTHDNELERLLISIDTFHAKVAQKSLEAGANIINDISCGSFDLAILEVVSKYKAGYIGMHLTGSMHAMHTIEPRENVMNSLLTYFEEKRKLLLSAGIQQWVIDPGFGFGKTMEENFRLIRELSQLNSIGLPVLLGASRKSSIYKTLGITAEEALNGTSMVHTVALLNGANIIRVHDVKEAVELVKLLPFLK